MSDNTKIEWADATLNYVNGCSVHSPGCTNCYAMRLAGTRLKHHPSRAGLTTDTKAGPVWTGEVRENPKALEQALRWKKPRAIFWNAHGDLFHENVPDEWIDRQFAVMALTPQHRHMVLTKRSGRMRDYMGQLLSLQRSIFGAALDVVGEGKTATLHKAFSGHDEDLGGDVRAPWMPLPNVWLGVSVEDQRRADERIPDLLATPAAIRFISAEPLLGPVNLEAWLNPEKVCQGCDDGEGYGNHCASDHIPRDEQCPWKRAVQTVIEHGPLDSDGMPAAITSEVQLLDWVIAGGESGPGARPMHPDWARSLRDQCAPAGVPFHFKQWGEWSDGLDAPLDFEGRTALLREPSNAFMARVGKARAGRLLDGVEHDGVPS